MPLEPVELLDPVEDPALDPAPLEPVLLCPEPLVPRLEPLDPECVPNEPVEGAPKPDCLPLTLLEGEPRPLLELLLPPCCKATVRDSDSTMRSSRATRSSIVPVPATLLLAPNDPELLIEDEPPSVEELPSVPLLEEDDPRPGCVLLELPSPEERVLEEPRAP